MKSESWKIFDQISKTYDRVNWILSLGQDTRWRKQVAKNMPLRPHLEVLDLATGTGDQLLALKDLSIRRKVGIDLSEEMLKIARTKVDAEFIHADAQQLPFGDSNFDATTFSFGIRNVPEPLLSLKEIHRVLKPKGRCLVLEFSMPNRWVRPFYLVYLRHILPRLGGLFSKNFAAYRYLNETIETFPSGPEFLALMKDAGFTTLQEKRMNLGTVTLYIGEK